MLIELRALLRGSTVLTVGVLGMRALIGGKSARGHLQHALPVVERVTYLGLLYAREEVRRVQKPTA